MSATSFFLVFFAISWAGLVKPAAAAAVGAGAGAAAVGAGVGVAAGWTAGMWVGAALLTVGTIATGGAVLAVAAGATLVAGAAGCIAPAYDAAADATSDVQL